MKSNFLLAIMTFAVIMATSCSDASTETNSVNNTSSTSTELKPVGEPNWFENLLASVGFDSVLDKYVDENINRAIRAYLNDMPSLAESYCHSALNLDRKCWKAYALLTKIKDEEKDNKDYDSYDAMNNAKYASACVAIFDYARDYFDTNTKRELFVLDESHSISYEDIQHDYIWAKYCYGDYSGVLDYCQSILESKPNDAYAMRMISYSYSCLKEYERAERYANMIIEKSDDKKWGYYALGYMDYFSGNKWRAIQNFEKYQELNGKQEGSSCYFLAELYLGIDRDYSIQLRKRAAKEGNRDSQKWLNERGIKW